MKSFFYKIIAIVLTLSCLSGCAFNDNSQSENSAAVSSTADEELVKVNFLNVGKADCIAIEIKDKLVMIDTGTAESYEIVEKYMTLKGYAKIDKMIITHFDKDHVGGASYLIDNYEIGEVMTTFYEAKESSEIDAYHESLDKKSIEPTLVSEETSFQIDDVSFTVYPPMETDYGNNTSNDSSLVTYMTYDETSFLFTGDAEKARIKEILEIPGIQADVIKIPHHGKIEKNTDSLLEYINPSYAVITSSDDEPEDEELMDLLEERNIITYLTREGMVSASSNGKELSFSQFVFM
ncbi:MAG: MBL fold metallo-hydrolase [Butyrivibrio sp.]|nr:MBL fold metallo-hydrolase [Butyrivibrio sp.]